jgi:hypothetical protein
MATVPDFQEFRRRATAQSEALLDAIAAAEQLIVATIERECEAVRSGQLLAARALHTRLGDASRFYLNACKAARASMATIERLLPGSQARLEEQRAAFAATLKVELAVLAAEHAARSGADPEPAEKPARPPPPRVVTVRREDVSAVFRPPAHSARRRVG